jgi:cupin fold WbuC family metalloprotein
MKQLQPGVYVAEGEIVRLTRAEVRALKRALPAAPRGRTRVCAHQDSAQVVQEMLIVLGRDGYVRPHRHHGKSESFHVVEGRADIVVFNDDGRIREVIPMGPADSGRVFFYRIDAPFYHTLVIRTPVFVIHETTCGPFKAGATEGAPWAPAEDDVAAGGSFQRRLQQAVRRFRRGGKERRT